MSDLIERLRRDGYTIGGWDEALSELEAQQAEIARLRGLVETAYKEGAFEGQYYMGGEVWERSSSFKALEQKP